MFKFTKNNNASLIQSAVSLRVYECAPYNIYRLLRKKKNRIILVIEAFGGAEIVKSRKKRTKKVLFHQENAPRHESLITMIKLHELYFELLLYPPYLQNLALGDYYRFTNLKKIFNSLPKLSPILRLPSTVGHPV